MDRWTVGSLAGIAVVATIVLGAATGCGLGVTEPRFQDVPDTASREDNTTFLFERGELRLAELARQEVAPRS